jgi:hypothetical protein
MTFLVIRMAGERCVLLVAGEPAENDVAEPTEKDVAEPAENDVVEPADEDVAKLIIKKRVGRPRISTAFMPIDKGSCLIQNILKSREASSVLADCSVTLRFNGHIS